MKVRNRLTILYTLITASILTILCSVIYLSSSKTREKEFYALLSKEAYTKASLFLQSEIDGATLQKIYRNNRDFINEVEVAIYDTAFKLVYHDAVDIDIVKEDDGMLKEILQKGQVAFYQGKWQVIGTIYLHQQSKYIITAAALDQYGYNKLSNLANTILVFWFLSVLLVFGAGWFFAGKSLQPVSDMIYNVRKLTANNLHLRLPLNKSKDELYELAQTFNDLLDRLEKAFETQNQFISNISHELRTPLAAMMMEMELALNGDRKQEEYQKALQDAFEDAKRTVKLLNALLDLAKAGYDPSQITFRNVCLEEVIQEAILEVKRMDRRCKVATEFANAAGGVFIVRANEYLLKTAFINFLENACKYSNHAACTIRSRAEGKSHVMLEIHNDGIPIPEEELDIIYLPFKRGRNSMNKQGSGIGLALCSKIIDLHGGSISASSHADKGTTFTVMLPLSKEIG